MDDVALVFSSAEGEEIAFVWPFEALAGLDPMGPAPPWRLEGKLDWDRVERIRVLSARLTDDRAFALAAIRPAGISGHGEEAIAGVIVSGGEPEQLEHVLLSVERRGDGSVRRIGLELYQAGSELPTRVAADAADAAVDEHDGRRRRRSPLELRVQGTGGVGIYEELER